MQNIVQLKSNSFKVAHYLFIILKGLKQKKTIKLPSMSYLLLTAAIVLIYFIMFKYVIAHADLEDKI